MKRYSTGLIIFDKLDIICISFATGSTIAWGTKLYTKYRQKRNKGQDPIIAELKETSPITMFSTEGKPLKPPLFRGGDRPRGFSLVIKNKKLFQIVMAIVNAKKKQRKLRLLSTFFFLLNTLLSDNLGLRFALGGSVGYTQIILFGIPSTMAGFIMGKLSSHPILCVLIPILALSGRGIENIPDSYEQCRYLCEAAATYHNKELLLEMENLNSLIEDTAAAIQLPIDKVPLLCDEQPLSLLERYKLRSVVNSAKARNRIQYFSEFIKKFPECTPDPETVYEESIKITKQIKVPN